MRGRIDVLKTETGRLLERGQVFCEFETHTMNTPRNRLVKSALIHLGKKVSHQDTSHRCRALAAAFTKAAVYGGRPSRAELATDQMGRNDAADKLMVSLSNMVFQFLIPDARIGSKTHQSADITDQLVRKLFEKAVGNALRLTLDKDKWTVKQGSRLSWPIENASEGMTKILPGMQTDIEVLDRETNRNIVIDTKYTSIFTSSNYRSEMLKSGYLYQLYTYLRSQEAELGPGKSISEGMLVHPQVGASVDEFMELQGQIMRFRTVDLATRSDELEKQLTSLI